MADQEITVPMEEESLSSLMADEPEQQETVVEETAQQREDRERDEKGRFVAKAKTEEQVAPEVEAQAEVPAQTDKDEQGGNVPSWRLREVREAREAAERKLTEEQQRNWQTQQQLTALQNELAQLRKPKAEPVDFFQNPDEAFQQRFTPVQEQIAQLESKMKLATSRALAVAMHGTQAVSDMEAAIAKAEQQNNPDLAALGAQMRASDDPIGVAMQWHKRASLVERTGGDLDAYVQKQLDEKLKDPAFLAKAMEQARTQAGAKPPPSIQIPPSLNKATGSAAQIGAPDDNDVSDSGLFRHAMGSRR
jgi:hypothetical protein